MAVRSKNVERSDDTRDDSCMGVDGAVEIDEQQVRFHEISFLSPQM